MPYIALRSKRVTLAPSDTESFTFQAAKIIRQFAKESNNLSPSPDEGMPLRVLDLCTGTGCIALLLHALLAPNFQNMQILGIDISPTALKLAHKNLAYNLRRNLLTSRALSQVHFHRADVLGKEDNVSVPTIQETLREHFPRREAFGNAGGLTSDFECDLLISNPPYISNADFRNGTTSRSVRRFEPQLALVPNTPQSEIPEGCNAEDVFYHRILSLSLQSQAKITVLECGDTMQACRVVAMHQAMSAKQAGQFITEVWPNSDQDFAANGFHPQDGSRCVIIQRRDNVNE
ncbi:hypothetical protein N7466_009874 [Penicillium verhagenii]|uniref:uncharacterized protein n=1 Tax=Penicillium verhagenii TaxID=1562060 RepID=UPI002545A9AF|nr:uncharacterized protein N7466_009874 [Penicillium verhagenii]KAJ5921548.1 hypothetical protein N7466_009874 [Penicillium verhagenii]